jgi:lambda family phage portal protein
MKPKIKLNALDKFALAVSPGWGAGRIKNKLSVQMLSDDGFVIPGSRTKSMKGITARANSPDVDIIKKLDGTRALSRNLFMSGGLATSIYRRLRTMNIGSGLQLQSSIDRESLGITDEEAQLYEMQIEREFDMWSESQNADFMGESTFGELQALGYINMLISGDFFWMPVWRKAPEKDFPYELSIKIIDADLVRDPEKIPAGKDIKGGVEVKNGVPVAYHVWNTYPSLSWSDQKGKSVRVPIWKNGRRQIYHVYDPERINQRRGIGRLANSAEQLVQLSRAAQAELMALIISSYFTVFVKDMSGMNSLLGPSMTQQEQVTGVSTTGTDSAPSGEPYSDSLNDYEMGVGNILNLDENKEITVANPDKADKNFPEFYKTLAVQACSNGSVPYETVMMHYQTSYTAARAASNDARIATLADRTLMSRKFNSIVFAEFFQEALLRQRIEAPGFWDDYGNRRAWLRCYWVGSGRGSLNPLHEAKASVLELNNYLTTHEHEYTERHGGRWDVALDRRAREDARIKKYGLYNRPDDTELIGPDGQEDVASQQDQQDQQEKTK